MRGTVKRRIFAVSSVIVLLTISGFLYFPTASGGSSPASKVPSDLTTGANLASVGVGTQAFDNASTYGVGLSGAPVVLDGNALAQMEGSPPSIANMEKNITDYFVPLGVHLVFLDIFWGNDANTSSTLVAGGRDQAVSDWLSLGVKYQIDTILFLKQFGYFFSTQSWDQDFLNTYPEAATANGSGVYVPLTACSGCTKSSGWTIASPLVYRQYEMDLKQLWLWYGQYSSWVGIGEGATGDRKNYGSVGTAIKSSRPFDNFTMYTYANSVFFQRIIDPKTGTYLSDGTVSKIWSMFVNDRPDLFATTGTALTENANYTISGNNVILQRFYVPFGETLNGFTLKAMLATI